MSAAGEARPPYPQLVFSGGGTRCLWHGGFLHAARDVLVPAPERIAAVSGGALTAAGFVTHRGRRVLELMCEAFADQERNVTAADVADGRGLSPHQRIYREVVEAAIGDAEAREAVAEGPDVQIVLGHPPSGGGKLAGTLAALLYEAELAVRSRPHLSWAQAGGMETTRVSMREVARAGRLTDLVCAAATIPPVFDLPRWDGRPVIDAGMSGHAPIPEPDQGPTLILLTRRYRNLPEEAGRTYVQPSEAVPADKIDFTDPAKLRRTWDQGEADARAHLERLEDHQREETP